MKNLIIAISALLLAGCATIFKTDKGEVPIIIPPGTSVFLKSGDSISVRQRRDGTQFVKIEPDKEELLVFKKDTNTAIIPLNGYIEATWIIGNIYTLGPGFFVDGFTGNWYSYEEIPVSFSGEDEYFIQQIRLRQQQYWDTLRGIFSDDPKVFAYAAWGVAGPVYQVPVLGNVLSGGIGFRATSWLDICAETEFAGSLDLGKFDQGGGIIRYGGAVRIRPLAFVNMPGWYAAGSAGLFNTYLQETGRYVSSTQTDTIAGLQKTIPGVTYGVGYSGQHFWAEWKYAAGLQTIEHPHYGKFTPSYSTVTIGLSLYF